MAYPDFTTSNAPDFVSNILRIPRDFNEMGNANARTQIAAQQAATDNWIAQIRAEKAKQEIANEPAVQARAEKLAQSEVELRNEQAKTAAAMRAGNLESQRWSNMVAKVGAQKATDSAEDDLTEIEMRNQLMRANGGQPVDPDTYASDDNRTAFESKFNSKFHDPNRFAKAYYNFSVGNQDYESALARRGWTQSEVSDYNTNKGTMSENEAHAATQAGPVAERKAQEAARVKVIEAKALLDTRNETPTLTAPENVELRTFLGTPPKIAMKGDPSPTQRSKAAVAFANAIIQRRLTGKAIDPDAIWNEALREPGKSELDKLFETVK